MELKELYESIENPEFIETIIHAFIRSQTFGQSQILFNNEELNADKENTNYFYNELVKSIKKENKSQNMNTTFNIARAKSIVEAIENVSHEWLKSNSKIQVDYREKTISLKNFLALKLTDRILEDTEYEYYNKYNDEKDRDIAKRIGITKRNLNSKRFGQMVYSTISGNVDLLLEDRKNNQNKIEIPLKYNKSIKITYNEIVNELYQIIPIISKWDEEFNENLIKEIKKEYLKEEISLDQYSFDTDMKIEIFDDVQSEVEEVTLGTIEISRKKAPRIKEKYKVEMNIEIPIIEQEKVLIEEKEESDAEKFVKTLNPELLEMEIDIDGYFTVPASLYVQERIYPYLPKNKNIVLENGKEVTSKAYVEEFLELYKINQEVNKVKNLKK